MGSKTIVLDIDNTLADYTGTLREYCHKRSNIDYPCPNPNLYSFATQPGWPWGSSTSYRDYHRQAVESGLYLMERPYPFAVRETNRLFMGDCDIVIATNRKDDERGDTLRWLETNGIHYNGLYFGDKLKIQADLWVDDDPQVLKQLEEQGLPAMHPAHEYCKDCYGLCFDGWKDFSLLARTILDSDCEQTKQ